MIPLVYKVFARKRVLHRHKMSLQPLGSRITQKGAVITF